MGRISKKTFYAQPPEDCIRFPDFPGRPDLFNEVEWAPFISPKDAKLAHRLWHLPDSVLERAVKPEKRQYPRPPDEKLEFHALISSVYESLMLNTIEPTIEDDWQTDWKDKGLEDAQWSLQNLQDLEIIEATDQPILVEGHDRFSNHWTVDKLRKELKRRGLPTKRLKNDLIKCLYEDEEKLDDERHSQNLLPRSDLSHWGIERQDKKHAIRLTKTNHLKPLDMYTWAISLSPYNPTYWVSRAYCHYQQAYFDLAIGDAYRAQLLCEVLANPRSRNRQPGLYTRIWQAVEQHILAQVDGSKEPKDKQILDKLRDGNGINYFVPTLRKTLHHIISLSLAALQCWEDYKPMESHLTQRLIMPFNDTSVFERRRRVYDHFLSLYQKDRTQTDLYLYEKRAGYVRGDRKYPYEAGDKDRHESLFLERLNDAFFKDNKSVPWKRCKIEGIKSSKTLGVFATQDITKGEMIFAEEPSVRGHLQVKKIERGSKSTDTAQSDNTDQKCENCRKLVDRKAEYDQSTVEAVEIGREPELCRCVLERDGRTTLSFCRKNAQDASQTQSCSQISGELYHYHACGKNWTWLHGAMRLGALNHHDRSYWAYSNEEHGTVLSLLLREIFDTTLLRREKGNDPNIMAHELDELLVLEDIDNWEGNWFPFTFAANIQVPFDILLQLGVDIFRDLTFDTWVIQTILKKLLVNVVPWDSRWRGSTSKDKPWTRLATLETQDNQTEKELNQYQPLFQNLYLFPGFSMFNHACSESQNATWAFDETIKNRVLVWATENIPAGTEIRIPYRDKKLSTRTAHRLLGRDCTCKRCVTGRQNRNSNSNSNDDNGDDGDDHGNDSGEDSFDETPSENDPKDDEEHISDDPDDNQNQQAAPPKEPAKKQMARKRGDQRLAADITPPVYPTYTPAGPPLSSKLQAQVLWEPTSTYHSNLGYPPHPSTQGQEQMENERNKPEIEQVECQDRGTKRSQPSMTGCEVMKESREYKRLRCNS